MDKKIYKFSWQLTYLILISSIVLVTESIHIYAVPRTKHQKTNWNQIHYGWNSHLNNTVKLERNSKKKVPPCTTCFCFWSLLLYTHSFKVESSFSSQIPFSLNGLSVACFFKTYEWFQQVRVLIYWLLFFI